MNKPLNRFYIKNDNAIHWSAALFHEVFDFLSSKPISRDQLNYEAGVCKNIHYGDILTKLPSIVEYNCPILPYVNSEIDTRLFNSLNSGDIVIADTAEDYMVGTAVEVSVNDGEVITAGLHTMACRPKIKFAKSYLGYYLNSPAFHNQLKRLVTGTKVLAINKSEIINTVIKFPSFEEQQQIAEFFTALDEKIRCLDDLAKCFSQSMQCVLNKVFTQQISFKDENGNNYSEWTSKTIKDVAPLQRGFDLPTSQLQDGECTVIYSNGQTAKHSAFKCDGCAVVTGRSGTIGKVFYLDNCKYWPHNTTLWVTDFCGNNPKFIYYLLKFVGLEQFSTGTGVPTLNRNDVHDYVVKIPSIDEQTKIVEFLDCYNKKLNLLISKKHAFQELKKAFMQRMFV